MDTRLSRIGETLVQYKERRAGEVKLVFERKVVKKLLLGLGVDRVSLGVDRPDAADDDGSYMTFAWLYDKYPTFPVILVARDTWMPDEVDFFRVRSRKNSFWPVWEDLTESFDPDKNIGCVFKFPEVTDMGLGIVHNVELPYNGYDPGIDFVSMTRRSAGKRPVVLEQFTSFVNRLRLDWEPT